jgi:hypothetical protein
LLAITAMTIRTIIIVCLAYFLTGLGPASGSGENPSRLYYSKLEIISANGTIITSKLEMMPIDEDYRADDFKVFRVSGDSGKNCKTDLIPAAQHDAVSKILSIYGLKSVNSRQMLVNNRTEDITTLRYEGAVQYPFKIISREFLKHNSSYSVIMDVHFSPISFPTKWSYLYLKENLKKYLMEILQIF